MRILPGQLALRIPLLAAILLVGTIIIYTWIAVSDQLKVAEKNINLMGSTLSKNLAAASADYVLANDFASLEQLLLQAIDFPEVRRIQVCDKYGRIISDVLRNKNEEPRIHFGSSDIVPPSSTKSSLREQDDLHSVHWYPIEVGDTLGWVRVEQSLDELHIISSRMWRDSVSIASLGILISGLLLFLYLRKPMSEMRKASEFAMRLEKSQGEQIALSSAGLEIQWLQKSLNFASTRLYEVNKVLSDQKFALDQSSIVCIADINRQITYANEKFCEISGYRADELKGLNQYFLCADFHSEEFFQEIWSKVLNGKVWRGEMKNRTKNNEIFWVDATVVPFIGYDGKPYQFVSIQKDITDKKLVEEKLSNSEHHIRSILENTGDGIVTLDENAVIQSFNRSAEKIFGVKSEGVIGKQFSEFVTNASNESGMSTVDQIFDVSKNSYPDNNIELVGIHRTGATVPLEITVSKIKESEKKIYIISMRDVTERLETEEHLRHLAHHDTLTGLPNRISFLDRLDRSMALCQRRQTEIAVLFMDVDHFKLINDTLGHDVGDRLLKEISERLKQCVRKGDTVARLGGDEFTFLLEDISAFEDIPRITEKIVEMVSRPVVVDERELFITASIGISRYPGDGDSGVELLKNADTAMYRAKEEGRNNYQFYSMEMSKLAHERLSMETYLRHALKHDEFFLEYQPQINITTGKVVSLEALVRWNHPDKGRISPLEFVPLLEETGLIVPLGEWILETACKHCVEWDHDGSQDISVFVNLSARQFREESLVSVIKGILQRTGLQPERLGIEITESILMRYSNVSSDILDSCSKMGISFALDDFGTGYSSLSYLRRFPINTIKIDKSFIRDIHKDSENSEIVKAILAMGQSLRLSVVAEGVETIEELTLLRNWGCQIIQGFVFSKPVSAETVPLILEEDYLSTQVISKIKDVTL